MRDLADLPWGWIAAGYGAASLVTFVAYGLDKRRARRGGRRIPERVLHRFAFAGGFPGAYAGRAWFRHKTRKAGFAWALLAAAALHAALWAAWLRL